MAEDLTLEQLEEIYMDGMVDQQSGDVECPTGHFYRVGHQIVTTDNQGFKEVDTYEYEGAAIQAFENLDDEYAEWDDDSTNLDF